MNTSPESTGHEHKPDLAHYVCAEIPEAVVAAAESLPPRFLIDATLGPDHRDVDENDIARHYICGTLSPQDRAAFERHAVDCAECADRILLAGMFKIREHGDAKVAIGTRAGA